MTDIVEVVEYALSELEIPMSDQLARALAGVDIEVARLRVEVEQLRKALSEKVISQTMLRDLSIGSSGINATFEGGAAHLLADAFAEQFVESDATNYLEMHLHSNVTGPLIVTLQRHHGKTPHQLRAEAEAERDALRAELDALKAQEPVKLLFPRALRKMWSGEEVQKWIDAKGPLYTRPVPASAPEGSVVQSAARIMNFDLIKQRDILMEAITSIRSLSAEHPKDPVACSIAAHQIAERAMLATTPEVK
jgi:hypothetical protein